MGGNGRRLRLDRESATQHQAEQHERRFYGCAHPGPGPAIPSCAPTYSWASRFVQSGGSSCRKARNTPLVQPNPTTLVLYPAATLVSEERVTTLYFSRMVPSRWKFSSTVERNL